MKGRILLALTGLALALACQNPEQPSSVRRVPIAPSKIISDGSHVGGNPDFFFLPPLVPLPFGNATFKANFELGKFNNALGPSLKVEICELIPEPGNALPTPSTACARVPLKTFDFGSVKVVNLPLRESGWWSFRGLPPDGFYYVLWDTREPQSNLDVSKYYRIKVFLDGFTDPLGYADVDPMSSWREWRYSQTGQVIQLVNGVLLPIPFRVEKNGSPCRNTTLCTQQVVTNHTVGQVDQFVRVQGGAGPLAGALFPDGWLPAAGPQSVLVTISRVNTGSTKPDGTQAVQCHRNLPLQQYDGCFKFSTYPKLKPISVAYPGHQFEKPVTTAVCFTRIYSEDPRLEWVQLWASDDGANFRKLPDVDDALILTPPGGRNCNNPVITDNSPGLRGLASTGWRKLKGGLGQIFGVQTAYAVDVGLGGTGLDLSNISPALTAQIHSAGLSSGPGLNRTASVQILGISHHNLPNAGVNGIPVTFTVAASSGNFGFGEGGPILQRVVYTRYTNPVNSEGYENGIASVNWTVLNTAGPHTMTANGPALGGPITFTVNVTVPPPIP